MMSFAVPLLMLYATPVGPTADAEWPPPYELRLLHSIQGITGGGEVVLVERGYVMHRVDVERVYGLTANLDTCRDELHRCNADRLPPPPSFWDSDLGSAVMVGLGVVAGAAAATGAFCLASGCSQ